MTQMNSLKVRYEITSNPVFGCTRLLASNLTQKEATKRAALFAADHDCVAVEWHRASDGQKGFLNQDGNHSITGRWWCA
jgi:hypothetical protein